MTKGTSTRSKLQARYHRAIEVAWRKAHLSGPKRRNIFNRPSAKTFMDLPRELRDMILTPLLTLPKSEKLHITQPAFSRRAQPAPKSQRAVLDQFRSLSLVSKAVHTEAQEFLYESHEVVLQTGSLNRSTTPCQCDDTLPDLPVTTSLLPGISAATVVRLSNVTVYDRIYKAGSIGQVAEWATCVFTLSFSQKSSGGPWKLRFKHRPNAQKRRCEALRELEDLKWLREAGQLWPGEIEAVDWEGRWENAMAKWLEERAERTGGIGSMSMGLVEEVVRKARQLKGYGLTYCPAAFREDVLESI